MFVQNLCFSMTFCIQKLRFKLFCLRKSQHVKSALVEMQSTKSYSVHEEYLALWSWSWAVGNRSWGHESTENYKPRENQSNQPSQWEKLSGSLAEPMAVNQNTFIKFALMLSKRNSLLQNKCQIHTIMQSGIKLLKMTVHAMSCIIHVHGHVHVPLLCSYRMQSGLFKMIIVMKYVWEVSVINQLYKVRRFWFDQL